MLIGDFVLTSNDNSILETVYISPRCRHWNSNTKYGNDNLRYSLCALLLKLSNAWVTKLDPGGPVSCRVWLQLASTHLPGSFKYT